jgi:hypothetical protein
VVADPAHGLGDLGDAAAGQAQLAYGGSLLTGDQAPQDLAADQRRDDRDVARGLEQPQHAHGRVDQLARGVTDRDRRRRADSRRQ